MVIPEAIKYFAQYFHQDALYDDLTVDDVIYEFWCKCGTKKLRNVQRFMAESLAKGDLAVMKDQWLQADSDTDFEENTAEFFSTSRRFQTLKEIIINRTKTYSISASSSGSTSNQSQIFKYSPIATPAPIIPETIMIIRPGSVFSALPSKPIPVAI